MPPCRHKRSEKGHAQDRTRLPVGRSTLRRSALDAADRQPEVLHPRREHVAKHAPGFLDIELLGLRFVLHERWFPGVMVILEGIRRKWILAQRLKMPDLRPYDRGVGSGSTMFRRLALIFSVVAMGLALNGCTKCGPIWDDWVQSPKSCKSDRF